MDNTTLFGFAEILAATVYFFICGLCVAKRRHLTAFKGLIFSSLTMGFWDLFQGFYYIYQAVKFSTIMLSIVYAAVPFTYLTFFIVVYMYAYPDTISKSKFIKFLFIIPAITVILAFTHEYQNIFVTYGTDFYFRSFREIHEYYGIWIYIVRAYDIFISILTIILLIYTLKKLNRQNRKIKFIFALILITITINITVPFAKNTVLLYFDLIMRVASIILMYLTLDKDEAENIIFQGQIKLIESFPFPIIFQDRTGRIVHANEKAIEICKSINDFILGNHNSSDFFENFKLYKLPEELEFNDKNLNDKIILQRKNTDTLYFLQSQNIVNKKSDVIGKMYMFITLNSIQNFVGDLTTMALKDKLCGFYNRYYLEMKKKEFENNKKSMPLTLIMCDLNNLKLINDSLGHDFGDEYILHCCNIIKKTIRREDTVMRLGGDEFLIILAQTTNEMGLKIATEISSHKHFENFKDYKIGIATGTATTKSSDFNFDELLKEADENMYAAKRQQKENIND